MIESLQNDKIKYISKLLTDNRFRKKTGVFLVEGKQENETAQKFGFEIEALFIAPEIYKDDIPNEKVELVSEKIYDKLAYRKNTEGIIGVYKSKENKLEDLKIRENSTIIVVEGAEKPGNLGAILRSCEAFGIDAVIVTDAKVDFYNPNVIRSSVGCIFGMNIFNLENEEAVAYLQKNNFQIFTTLMDDSSQNIQSKDFAKKSAIIFGTEHSGLSNFWRNKGENVLIPMSGSIDSLNLSNAVAIACYEILRQKTT
ncbi:TrmH family RNA methyltransferase [Frigoriflavimonas asaccharolytica]|uniref:TrmH family RNA methyltransferase n=1 Tax=Frigoriflavimonas asaccharolytica TaxID=2735899 RepID=A0A8J8GA26_9FLAO|nr:TrmH family RNA methyltransferase [Frigoriflavimonas asaccharolytica]NRS92727.1 TrmH family RNA methyltransferase [Frigoriflavimonas asaccharolytica]